MGLTDAARARQRRCERSDPQPEHPTRHEASEEIEVLLLSADELGKRIEESKNADPPLVIDSRVYAWYLAQKSGNNL